MNLTAALRALLERRDLTHSNMTEVMRALMSGEATPAQIGGLLIGLVVAFLLGIGSTAGKKLPM